MHKGTWGKTVAFFDIKTEEGFIIKGFRLVEGENGIFVGYPSKKDGSEDKYNDTVYADQQLKEAVLEMAKLSYSEDDPISSNPPPMVGLADEIFMKDPLDDLNLPK